MSSLLSLHNTHHIFDPYAFARDVNPQMFGSNGLLMRKFCISVVKEPLNRITARL